MNLRIATILFMLFSVQGDVSGQTYISENFGGDSLPETFTIFQGSSSNFSVQNGLLNALNTVGGVIEDPWRKIAIRTNFFAPDSFFFFCKFNYQRVDYRTFEIRFRNVSDTSLVWFRLWDSPSDWILLGKSPANPDCNLEIATSLVPANLQVLRLEDTVRVIWDGIEQWKCHIIDTITSIEFRFEDCPGFGGNVAGISIDSVFASFSCCVGSRGDFDNDGDEADFFDLIYLIDDIFRGGPATLCANKADVNSDGVNGNILDLNYLVNRIFRGGPPPGPC